MLATLKDKRIPDWPSGLSVNAILSVLVTVMKGATGITIAECLSQLKWSWFKRQRKLGDLETFDEASRGAWGAAILLITPRRWLLAYLGAFAFLSGFIIGPTIQLTVEVRVREVEIASRAASVPVCNTTYFDVIGLGSGPGLNLVTLPTIGAMYDGLLQTTRQNKLTAFCPSGNCTFPTYQSLGFCNDCADITDKLRFYMGGDVNNTQRGYPAPNLTLSPAECQKYGLDNLCYVTAPGYGINLRPYGMINSTINYTTLNRDLRPSQTFEPVLGSFRGIVRRNSQSATAKPDDVSAVECSLRFCVKTYEGAVRQGEFSEKVISSTWVNSSTIRSSQSDSISFDFTNSIELQANPCYVNGHRKTPPYNEEDQPKCLYNVSTGNALSIQNTLDDLLSGSASDMVGNRPIWSNNIMTALWGMFTDDDWTSPESGTIKPVEKAMNSLADSLTNHARGSSAICAGASAAGTQLADQLYLHVHWIWLAPTVAVLVLCLTFFVGTIVQSWGETLWKSSVFAYLFCRPLVDGKELSAETMLKMVGPGSGVGTGVSPSPNVLERTCKQMEVEFDTTLRFRTSAHEAR